MPKPISERCTPGPQSSGSGGGTGRRAPGARTDGAPKADLVSPAEALALLREVKDYAIFMLDCDGRVLTWNDGARAIKGYAAEEIIGQSHSRFYTQEDLALGRPSRLLRRAVAEGRAEDEGWRVRKDGSRFWANVVVTAIHDEAGGLRGFVKVTRDLSERRDMEGRVREATAAAGKERVRAMEADYALRLRDEFISVAAHELRTPLAALNLKVQGLQAILNRMAPAASPVVSARLDDAVRQIERLSELVERLLDVSRLVRGRLVTEPEETDLAALVREVMADFREPALQAGSRLRFRSSGPVVGMWDKARIEQVVINLISNAIKYGVGKPIDLKVEGSESSARLVVSDRGIGIEPADIYRIFDRFERAAPAQHYGGLGIGLYIAQKIIEAHGGSIRVSSVVGRGSTFVVDLPKRGMLTRTIGEPGGGDGG
jgi:PAS domain S-box-containing protein